MQGCEDVYSFGPKTRYGSLEFDKDLSLLLMHDTEKSFSN